MMSTFYLRVMIFAGFWSSIVDTSIIIKINNISNNNVSHCQSIQMKGGSNFTYCGITEEWEPRFPKETVFVGCVALTLACFTAAVIGISCAFCKSVDGCSLAPYSRWLPVGKLLLDVVDVASDIYTFYQLDQGNLVDSRIYRDIYVTMGILVFAVLGALKVICLSFAFIWFNTDGGDLETWAKHGTVRIKQFNTMKYKCLSIYLTFVFEDGVEMFLEYFWVEKYFTHAPPIYMVVKDALLVLVAVYAIFATCCHDRNPVSDCFFRLMQGMSVFIFLSELLRVIGAVYQYEKGILKSRDCLIVEDGRLIQAPFASGCLRKIDYAIAFFTFFMYAVVVVCFFCFLGLRTNGKSEYEEIEEEKVEPRHAPKPIGIPLSPVSHCTRCKKLLPKKRVKQNHRQCKVCHVEVERSMEYSKKKRMKKRIQDGATTTRCQECRSWLTSVVDEQLGIKFCGICQCRKRNEHYKNGGGAPTTRCKECRSWLTSVADEQMGIKFCEGCRIRKRNEHIKNQRDKGVRVIHM